jgi:mRNA interferase HigB
MRVHLIRRQTIVDFCEVHGRAKSSFADWLFKVRSADWETANDIRRTFGSCDLLGRGSNRAVFNIGGNSYRMICKYVFGMKQVHLFICWLGTHAEYNEVCSHERQYHISIY